MGPDVAAAGGGGGGLPGVTAVALEQKGHLV